MNRQILYILLIINSILVCSRDEKRLKGSRQTSLDINVRAETMYIFEKYLEFFISFYCTGFPITLG